MTNNLIFRISRIVVSVVVLSACASEVKAPTAGDSSCGLEVPPKSAGVSTNHGMYFFVFPRQIPPSYTGCQIQWGEDARRQRVLRFDEGQLKELENLTTLGVPATVCKYLGGALLNQASDECPSYEAAKNGVLTFLPDQEPQIPSGRDPRR